MPVLKARDVPACTLAARHLQPDEGSDCECNGRPNRLAQALNISLGILFQIVL
jgi:hypothetical protein